jgi:hypothetical protein
MPVGALVGVSIFGAGMKVYGDIKAGQAAKDVGDYNAQQYELQAQDAILTGTEQEDRFRSGVRGMVGTQRAGFAGQGVDIGQGTPVDVQADTAYLGELDALTIRQNAQRAAHGYEVAAQNSRAGGQAQATQDYFDAASTALGTGSSLLAAKYGWGKQNTILGSTTGGSSPGNYPLIQYGPATPSDL